MVIFYKWLADSCLYKWLTDGLFFVKSWSSFHHISSSGSQCYCWWIISGINWHKLHIVLKNRLDECCPTNRVKALKAKDKYAVVHYCFVTSAWFCSRFTKHFVTFWEMTAVENVSLFHTVALIFKKVYKYKALNDTISELRDDIMLCPFVLLSWWWCLIASTGFVSHSASISSSCACWRSRRSMVWHRRTPPTSANQSHQSAVDRDCDPPLVATSWSAPLTRTSAPVHSLWRAQRHGTSCRRIYGH